MDLFVGNLGESITESQLRLFFKGYDKQATFKLLRFNEEGPNGEEKTFVYGIVSFVSDRLAKKAIKKLNYKKINERPVIVREFYHRASQNDKRALNWRLKDWQKEERRGNERRKKREPVKSFEDFEVTAVDGFSRKYN